MTHSIITIDASPKQLSKLRKGKNVRIKKGTGFNLLVNPENYNIASRAFKNDKGTTISLTQDEITANMETSPEQHAELEGANNPDSGAMMAGQGIFGKKFDRAIKKAGIKKGVYAVGDALKPLAKQFIEQGLASGEQALSAYAPQFAPAIGNLKNKISHGLNSYIDNPNAHHNMPTQSFRQMGQSMLNDQLNQHLGTNYDYMSRAGRADAFQNYGNQQLIDYANRIKAQQEQQMFNQQHQPMGSQSYHGMSGHGLRRSQGIIGQGGGFMSYLPPALQSQPNSANFQFQHFLPVQYQQIGKRGGGMSASGLYA